MTNKQFLSIHAKQTPKQVQKIWDEISRIQTQIDIGLRYITFADALSKYDPSQCPEGYTQIGWFACYYKQRLRYANQREHQSMGYAVCLNARAIRDYGYPTNCDWDVEHIYNDGTGWHDGKPYSDD